MEEMDLMNRKFLDQILIAGGGALTVVLVVAGILLLWGSNFANSNVHNQLVRQDITFPTKAAFAHAKPGTEITPTMKQYLYQYAGEEVLTGAQAQAFATHFISIHLSELPTKGVYSKLSADARANPTTAKLASLEQVSFQGTTLRGLLLEAYGFSVFGEIASDAAIGAFCAAGVMLLLLLLGLYHLGRLEGDETFPKSA